VHGYGQLDAETVWETVTGDIPELCRKCTAILKSISREKKSQ
jgi:uncharacterized protein with HEPN domain